MNAAVPTIALDGEPLLAPAVPRDALRARINRRLGRDEDAGLTVIELLIVVLMISILAASQFPNLTDARKKTNDAVLKQDIRNTAVQIEMWFTENPAGTGLATLVPVVKSGGNKVIIQAVAGNANDYCILAAAPGATANGTLPDHPATTPAPSGMVFKWQATKGGFASASAATAGTCTA